MCLPPSLWKLVVYSYYVQKIWNHLHSISLGLAISLWKSQPHSTITSVTFGCAYLMLCIEGCWSLPPCIKWREHNILASICKDHKTICMERMPWKECPFVRTFGHKRTSLAFLLMGLTRNTWFGFIVHSAATNLVFCSLCAVFWSLEQKKLSINLKESWRWSCRQQ
jgi:hypothetical protein